MVSYQGEIKLAFVFFHIPVAKAKVDEVREFYKNALGFDLDFEGALVSSEYPRVGLQFFPDKRQKRSGSTVLSFIVSKNLPSIARRIKDFGIDVEIVTDMLEMKYAARFSDPAENFIQIFCDNIIDDSGVYFDVSIID